MVELLGLTPGTLVWDVGGPMQCLNHPRHKPTPAGLPQRKALQGEMLLLAHILSSPPGPGWPSLAYGHLSADPGSAM